MLISQIVAGLKIKYDRSYVHWRDHVPRKESKARALAAADASEILGREVWAQIEFEDLVRLGVKALHRWGYPPLCYDEQGNVYVLFSDGRREYDGRVYCRWIKKS